MFRTSTVFFYHSNSYFLKNKLNINTKPNGIHSTLLQTNTVLKLNTDTKLNGIHSREFQTNILVLTQRSSNIFMHFFNQLFRGQQRLIVFDKLLHLFQLGSWNNNFLFITCYNLLQLEDDSSIFLDLPQPSGVILTSRSSDTLATHPAPPTSISLSHFSDSILAGFGLEPRLLNAYTLSRFQQLCATTCNFSASERFLVPTIITELMAYNYL